METVPVAIGRCFLFSFPCLLSSYVPIHRTYIQRPTWRTPTPTPHHLTFVPNEGQTHTDGARPRSTRFAQPRTEPPDRQAAGMPAYALWGQHRGNRPVERSHPRSGVNGRRRIYSARARRQGQVGGVDGCEDIGVGPSLVLRAAESPARMRLGNDRRRELLARSRRQENRPPQAPPAGGRAARLLMLEAVVSRWPL